MPNRRLGQERRENVRAGQARRKSDKMWREGAKEHYSAHREAGIPPSQIDPLKYPKRQSSYFKGGGEKVEMTGQSLAHEYSPAPHKYLRQKAKEASHTPVEPSIFEGRKPAVRLSSGNRRATDAISTGRMPPKKAQSGPRSFSSVERGRLTSVRLGEHQDTGPNWDIEPAAARRETTRITTPNPVGRMAAGGYLRRRAAAKFAPTVGSAIKTAAKGFKPTKAGVARAAATIGAAVAGYAAGKLSD